MWAGGGGAPAAAGVETDALGPENVSLCVAGFLTGDCLRYGLYAGGLKGDGFFHFPLVASNAAVSVVFLKSSFVSSSLICLTLFTRSCAHNVSSSVSFSGEGVSRAFSNLIMVPRLSSAAASDSISALLFLLTRVFFSALSCSFLAAFAAFFAALSAAFCAFFASFFYDRVTLGSGSPGRGFSGILSPPAPFSGVS